MAAIKVVFNRIPDCSSFMCVFDMINFVNLFYYLAYIFLLLFMGLIALFWYYS